MKKVKKIFGRAGTGKTTALIAELQELLDSGVSPHNIGMVTHTRMGAQVFKERAINKFDLKGNDLPYFGTMHSLAWRRQGLKDKHIFGKSERDDFLRQYYPDMYNPPNNYSEENYYLRSSDKANLSGHPKIRGMETIDGLLSGCMINDYDFGLLYSMTGHELGYKNPYIIDDTRWSDKHEKYMLTWGLGYEYISKEEQIRFSENFREYLDENDLYSYAKSLETMYADKMTLPVEYLIFDEFQDFSKLQYSVYENWRDDPGVKMVVIAGDDAQTIFRFSSASATFMIETPCDKKVHLKLTYRHGQKILDNAQSMLDHMHVVEKIDVRPAYPNMKSEVIHYQGDEWLDHIDFTDPDESVLVLAASNQWVSQIKKKLDMLFPDTPFINIEDTRKVDRVFGMYNIIAALERGEEVPGVSSRDEKWSGVDSLFRGDPKRTLPQKMFYTTPQRTLSSIKPTPVLMTVLKRGVKSGVKKKEFDLRDTYTKSTFEKDFLKVPWVGRHLMNAIPDIAIFPQAPDVFPEYAIPTATKRIGTIHRSKGDEADTVLLFMGIFHPSLIHIDEYAVQDDVLRQFYVAKTRAKTKIIEVYDYVRYSNGEIAPSPLEVIS